jgi:RimJ/RimL family protein N-acetyltransferase
MKTQILEGRSVKLVPLAVSDRQTMPGNQVQMKAAGWRKGMHAALRSSRKPQEPSEACFSMCTTDDNMVIGTITLNGLDWSARSGWLGIGRGDAISMGKTCRTEATQLMLHYAFKLLGLNRVNLNLVSCDEREIHSFEEMGFKYEGTQREVLMREDEHLDIIDLGILRSDWELLNRFPME